MCQNKLAQTLQDRFKDKSARILITKSAPLFQNSNVPLYLVKTAGMFPSRSAEVFLVSLARTLQNRSRGRNVNLLLLRSALLFQTSSAGTSPSSSAAVCLIRTVPMFPSRSATLFQGSSVSRFQDNSARLLNLLMEYETSAVMINQ